LNVQLQYSSGVSARGGGLVSGWKGVMFRDWTVMPGMVVASGAPITIDASQLALGGAPNGNIRANYIGGPTYIDGRLNTAAFAVPAAGTYGNLGRDSLTGPMQFSTTLNALRTFRLADRKNMTFSVNVVNPINHPTVSSWNLNFSPTATQFGLPLNYSNMRTISANVRFNF
jgi:trimeric autotransporter adhesin